MHEIIVKIHIYTNVCFSLVAIMLCFSLIRGYFYNKIYSKTQLYLEFGYIRLLYFDLLLGIILYFFYRFSADVQSMNLQEVIQRQNSQFWAIEHFSVMIFALLIAQIGKIFTSKDIADKYKFKYALFYYGIATIIIFISMSLYLYHRFNHS
jgi:hypothetical protein